MGDQIGSAVEGALAYVPMALFDRVRGLGPAARASVFADLCRINALYMIARAGSGHIGSSFSSLDVVSVLLLDELEPDDVYFSSKGHDAPGLYAALIGLGRLPEDSLHRLRRLGGLPGHPDVAIEGIAANTGSLGMGISKAKGMVHAHRARDLRRRVFVLTGDGELQEGQIWESLAGAVHHRMSELTVIVDHNKLQSDTHLNATSDLGDLALKLRAFGWHVERVDGHDVRALHEVFGRLRSVMGPKIVIADTRKGEGVSFMDASALPHEGAIYRFHSGAPSRENYMRAVAELRERVEPALQALGAGELVLREAPPQTRPSAVATGREPQRLVAAYGAALLAQAQRHEHVVALDADLMVDMGLLPFKQALPERFFEHGIAEMDMVSAAGGLALRGMLPVCHSFACFLSARPNEHIYTNATERTRIVYVAGLSGLLPAGPGHSHQAVRDLAAVGTIPGLEVLQPSSEADVERALDYALHHAPGSTYLRLSAVQCVLPFEPSAEPLRRGVGRTVRAGTDATLIAYGPVMLSEAFRAAELLEARGISLEVVDLPWLNRLDTRWLTRALQERRAVFTLDDHMRDGGLGERIATALFELGVRMPIRRFGVDGIPACGANDEVLRHHGLDAQSLCEAIAPVLAR